MPDLYSRLKAIRERAPAAPRPAARLATGEASSLSAPPGSIPDDGWTAIRPLVWTRTLRLQLDAEFQAAAVDPPSGKLSPAAARLRFLDTETTGLSGGAGTWIFLAGWSQLVDGVAGIELAIRQFFLEDLGGEPELVEAIEQELGAAGPVKLVTYNGASFDLPLLRSRWILNGRQFPALEHLDCVHVSRRLWRPIADGASLAIIERLVLNVRRHDDIPGALVPRLYLDYLRRGAGPGFIQELAGVFRHHAQDMVSLAGLWMVLDCLERRRSPGNWIPWMPGDPLPGQRQGDREVEAPDQACLLGPRWPAELAIHARGLLRVMDAESGLAMARLGWQTQESSAWGRLLATLYKLRKMRDEAFEVWLRLWQDHADTMALVECLKHLEHHAGPAGRNQALDLLLKARLHPLAARPDLAAELERRENRLRRLTGRLD